MTAAQLRKALSKQRCPSCDRRTLINGMIFIHRAHCLMCGARLHIRLGFRRGAAKIEIGKSPALRQYGARRA